MKPSRKELILNIMQEQKIASIKDLAEALSCTEMTIRRNLNLLQQEGLIVRQHGYARLAESADADMPVPGDAADGKSTDSISPTKSVDVQGSLLADGYDGGNKGGTTGNGRTIGFVVFTATGKLLGMNSFLPYILSGIQTAARRHGYSITFINITRANIETEISYIREAGCAGFVIFATELQERDLPYFQRLNIPFVLFDNYFNDLPLNCVKVNNEQGTWISLKYLYDMGHRRIGYLGSGVEIDSFLERRFWAFSHMYGFGLKPENCLYYKIGYPHEEAEVGMDRILHTYSKEDLPTAFIGDNDLVVLGAMHACIKNDYRIPDDFSFVGFDGREECTLIYPKLTTVDLPRTRFGAEAVELLIRYLEYPSESFINIEIGLQLRVRESVRRMGER